MKQVVRIQKLQQLVSINLLLVLLLIPNSVKAIVKPTSKFYVNDYANILSDETEDYIYNMSTKLNNVDGTQIVVVTVKNLENMDLESYSNKLFNSFKIGDNEKNNGLLLLLSLEERKFRVEVGKGLEGILPDGKTGRFQDEYSIEYFKEDKWDEGMLNLYNAFYKEIVDQNNLNIDYTEPTVVEESSTFENMFELLIACVFFGFFVGSAIRTLISTNVKVGLLITSILLFVGNNAYFSGNQVISTVLCYLAAFIFGAFIGSFKARTYYGGYHGGFGGSSFGGGSSGGFGGGGSSSGGGSSRGF